MSDLYNNLDAPIPIADWSKEYGLSKSIMALWDFTASEPQHGGCIVKYDDNTNQATLADGVAHKVNSRRALNPENWVFRPHYPIKQNAKDGTWDVRLVAEHENQSDSRDNHGTMIVNQKNKKQWGWLNDIAWVRKLGTKAGDDELKFNKGGFLPALAGGQSDGERSVVATPTCRNGGFVTDGLYDGQWSQAGKFIIGPAAGPADGRPTSPSGGGAGTAVTTPGNIGGGYGGLANPNLTNYTHTNPNAGYMGGGYGGGGQPDLGFGLNQGVTLQGGGYSGLANPGAVAGYSTDIGQGSNSNGPIGQGGGYGGLANAGQVAGYSEAVGGNRNAGNPGDSSGQPSPFGDNGGSNSNSGSFDSGAQMAIEGGVDGGTGGPPGDIGAAGDVGSAGDSGSAGKGSGDNFSGSQTGNNTVVDNGPGQTQTDQDRQGNPGQTQTEVVIHVNKAVEWGMRADCGIDFGNGVIGRLVHEPMAATEGSGEPRLVKLFCDTIASPDDRLDTADDDSSNHQRIPKRVRKKAIRGWVRIKEASPCTPHYDFSYHGDPPNKENKSGSSGGSSGTPTGGAGVPGTTGTDRSGTSSGDMVKDGGVPPNEGGSNSPTGGGSSVGDSTTGTQTFTDGDGNTWTRGTSTTGGVTTPTTPWAR